MPSRENRPPVECLNNLEAQEGADIATTSIRGLLVSIIYRSYLDLGSHEPAIKRDAEHFFRSRELVGTPPFFTFRQICQELDLDPELLLAAVRQKSPYFDKAVPEEKPRNLGTTLRIYPGRRWKGWLS